MPILNEIRVDFPALPENETFARLVISAFVVNNDPTVEDLADLKTAVSEAVTNAIVHGYANTRGTVRLHAYLFDDFNVQVDIIDNGCGIRDIDEARRPFFTTSSEQERSGMGFTIIESFMDDVQIISEVGKGTTVRTIKRLNASARLCNVKEV